MRQKLLGALTAIALGGWVSPLGAQTFDIGLDAPSGVEDIAGATVQVSLGATLSSSGVETDDGAQAWSLSIATSGWTPVAATTSGTAGALIDDGGLRDPAAEGSFEKTEIIDPANNGGQEGIVSAVVLSFNDVVTAPPAGTIDILSVTLEGTVPDPVDDACEPAVCTAELLDGLVGSGEPVINTVTYRGDSYDPVLVSTQTRICPVVPKETGLAVVVDGGTGADDKDGSERTWTVDVDAGAVVDVQVCVELSTAIEPCATVDPGQCDGAENFAEEDPFGGIIFGCADMADNDSDGKIDAEDEDCRGVQGWSMSLKTADCYSIAGATTRGTVGDLDIRPPGLRDVEGSFEKTEVVDPSNPLNNGMNGVVSAVVLSFTRPIILPQVGDGEKVLLVLGQIDASALQNPGDSTDPCAITILDPADDGLAGSGEPVKTAVTVGGETANPGICSANVTIQIPMGEPEAQFIRCDPNDDGKNDIADAVWIVNELFVAGAPTTGCEDAGDCNSDNLGPDLSDAVFAIRYQFQIDGPQPAPGAPFPGCGPDPDADEDIGCATLPTSCPQ